MACCGKALKVKPMIAVLMYHEVSYHDGQGLGHITPHYVVSPQLFEMHIKALVDDGYRSLLLSDAAPQVEHGGKHVVITFDDGLEGNYTHALPILKAYGLRATFFVAAGSIGTPRFMSWVQLQELAEQGMSVQSHTVSHRPLQLLSDTEVYRELSESKKLIENHVGNAVTAVSMPHGSYDDRVLRIARELGYHYVCTSDVHGNVAGSLTQPFAVLGRFAITDKVSPARLRRWAACKRAEVALLRFGKEVRNIVKRMIGIENYRRLYRRYFRIEKPMG